MSSDAGRAPMFFAQNAEDYLLWRLFSDRPETGAGPGWVVDVGAFDGVYLSNSYALERLGWRALCVEPHAVYSRLCASSRPDAVVVRAACVGPGADATVSYFSEPMGLYSGVAPGRDEDTASRHRLRLKRSVRAVERRVRAVPLGELIDERAGPGARIDVLSVDTEGTETDVLAGADLSRTRPRVIIVEADEDEGRREGVKSLLLGEGYAVGRNMGGNILFARDRGDALAMREIPVRCRLARMRHPLGVGATIPDYLAGRAIDEVPAGVDHDAPMPGPSAAVHSSVRTLRDRLMISVMRRRAGV